MSEGGPLEGEGIIFSTCLQRKRQDLIGRDVTPNKNIWWRNLPAANNLKICLGVFVTDERF